PVHQGRDVLPSKPPAASRRRPRVSVSIDAGSAPQRGARWSMTFRIAGGTAWPDVFARARAAAPAAFEGERLRNVVDGAWRTVGRDRELVTPVDGTVPAAGLMLGGAQAAAAVRYAYEEHRGWREVPLAERAARVSAAVDALADARDLLALLLVWEIGKPWRLAGAGVDRALDGGAWDLSEIHGVVGRRRPPPRPAVT